MQTNQNGILKNKVALIFGAGGAIGSTVSKMFANEGATIYLSGRTMESLTKVKDEIVKNNGKADVQIVNAIEEKEDRKSVV